MPVTLSAGWEYIEAGWSTHDLLGGVVRMGRRGWGCYPLELSEDAPAHVARTREQAMRWLERRYGARASNAR